MTTTRKRRRRPKNAGSSICIWMSPTQRTVGEALQARTGLSLSHLVRRLMHAYHEGLVVPGLPAPGTYPASPPSERP